MIAINQPPTLDKSKPLSIAAVIANQVGMPPANADAVKPVYSPLPSQPIQVVKPQSSSARNIMLSWFGE